MALQTISGDFISALGAVEAGRVITFVPVVPVWNNGTEIVVGEAFTVVANGSGQASVAVEPGRYTGNVNLSYGTKHFVISVGGDGPYDWVDVVQETTPEALAVLVQQALDAAAAAGADAAQTALDRAATAADRVATAADRVATAADRVQTGLDRADAADSAATALLAAEQAGSTLYDSAAALPTSPTPANGTWGRVQTANGLQAWQVVGGTWTLIGWITRPQFDNFADFIASTYTFPAGTAVEVVGCGTYRAVASGGTLGQANAGGQLFDVVRQVSGAYGIYQFGPPSSLSVDATAVFQRAIDATTTLTTSGELAPGGGTVQAHSGAFRLNSTLEMRGESCLDLGHVGGELQTYAPDVGISMGWGAVQTVAGRISAPGIFGGRLNVYTDGAIGLGIEGAFAPRVRDLDINLRGGNQTGVHLKGFIGIAPYYGEYRIRVAAPGNRSGNIGVVFEDDADAASNLSRGVNRAEIILDTIRAVDVGADVQSCDGLQINYAQFESMVDTAVRFNHRPNGPDHTGSVTTVGSAQILDSTFVNDGQYGSCVCVITSGVNAGIARRASQVANGVITFAEHFPYPFEVGDTYEVYKATALNAELRGVSIETAPTAFDFKPGASNCRVFMHMRTQLSGSYVFKRTEDPSNSVARNYTTFQVTNVDVAPGATVYPQEGYTAGRGGFVLPETGWLDSIRIIGGKRGFGNAGLITCDVLKNVTPITHEILGAEVPLTARLTPFQQNDALGVRRTLKTSDFIQPHENLNIRLVASADLSLTEEVTVVLTFGHM